MNVKTWGGQAAAGDEESFGMHTILTLISAETPL